MLVSTDGRLNGADKSRERDKLNLGFGHGFGHRIDCRSEEIRAINYLFGGERGSRIARDK